jgi:hypothetical protein
MISRLGMKKAEVVTGRNQVILLCHHILQLRAAQAEFEALDSFRSDHTGSYRIWLPCPLFPESLLLVQFATKINVTVKAGNFVTFFAQINFFCRKCFKVTPPQQFFPGLKFYFIGGQGDGKLFWRMPSSGPPS